MPTERTNFLDVEFETASVDRLVSGIAETRADDPFRYVVTPNVDHVVRLHKQGELAAELREAYRNAALCLCDSKVLRLLAKWRGVRLRVLPGSDLTEILFASVIGDGDRVAVVGGDRALIGELELAFPRVRFVQHRPPMGLMHDPAARTKAAQFIAAQKARFTFICVGSPQQELIAAEAARLETARGMAFCVGAALEFITGQSRRAPPLARRLGLEWAHRLLSDPKRLWRRYLVEGPAIFLLACRWHRSAA